MLKKGQISQMIIERMSILKDMKTDDRSIDDLIKEDAESIEDYCFKAIKSATITIPKNSIQINLETGTNDRDIILNNNIQ